MLSVVNVRVRRSEVSDPSIAPFLVKTKVVSSESAKEMPTRWNLLSADVPLGASPDEVARETIAAHFDSGWVEAARDALGGPARVWKHPNERGSVGLIAPYSKDFCTTCNRLRVSAKGGLHLCLFGDGGHDLRPLLQNDADKENLKETVCELLDLKVAGHGLHDHDTGATPHFASIGG